MTIKKIIAVLAAAALALPAAGCGKKKNDKQEIASNAVNVTVYTAGTEYLENEVSYTGELKTAENTSNISKVGARIKEVYVDEGDYVNAGDVLAELDDTDIRNTYNSALAGYNSALAGYNSVVNSATKQASTAAKNNLTSAQLAYNQALENYNREKSLYEEGSSLRLAEQKYNDASAAYNREKELYDNDTSLVSARNNLKTAEDNLTNLMELYEIGGVSKQELDNAQASVENMRASLSSLTSQRQAAYDAAYSNLVSAEENLRTVRLNVSAAYDAAKNALDNASNALSAARENIGLTDISNKSNIETANASLESARTALNTAEDNLANTKIRALSSGYIASKNATIGQMASPGMELFSIKNTDTLMAEIEVTESIIPFIQQGTKAMISVQSAKLEGLEGFVNVVNPTKNEKTGMYTVQVNINNTAHELNAGMFADVALVTEASPNAITVPASAVMLSGDESYVYIASADGKTAEKRIVTTGIETDEYAEIITGVSIGERIIVTGQDYLSEDNNEINIVTD